jgi:hypothetical protein
MIKFMRTPVLVFTLLVLALISSKAGELPASQVSWQEIFGSSKADTNGLFCLMAHGYFRAPSTNVQSVTDAWLKKHPKAVVVPVSSFGPFATALPSSHFVYVWVEDGSDNLNLELVRRGCFDSDNEMLNPNEKLEASQKDYDAFIQKDISAGDRAKEEKIGIWLYTWYSTNTEADLLKPHLTPGVAPYWLFDYAGHIDFDAHIERQIRDWFAAHQTGWTFASVDDFSPSKTQLLCDRCSIEIDADRIFLNYEEHNDDPDTDIYIKRSLSPEEQSFWKETISQIKKL